MTHITNYSKTWNFKPNTIAYPVSVVELQSIVKNAKKIRTMGSRHSFSKGIVTEDTLVSLDKMDKILEINTQKHQARIQAGKKIKDIIRELEQKGYAFSNLGSIDAQSLAGAISTATHGTGINFQCLASQVESFKIIDGEGNDREYTKTDTEFYAIITGFGCFGIIYEIVLNILPCYQVRTVTDTADFGEVIEHLDSYVTGYDHFKFWWLVPDEKIIVFKNKRTNEPRNDNDFVRFMKDEVVAVGVYRTLVAIGKINRKKFIPKINHFLTNQVGKFFECVCKSYIGFLTPVPPIHRETEYAFDYKNAKNLLHEYRALFLDNGHTYNFVQEIRFSKADNFWLSPAYGRDSIWLSMYNMDTNDNWNEQLANFEGWAKKNGGRPHWGKEASLDAAYLSQQYDKILDFQKLMQQLDPEEKFVNMWIHQIFEL